MGMAMVSGLAVGVALAVDRRWGEPPTWAHPVVAMGRYLGALGPRLCAWPPAWALLGGALAWWAGVLGVAALALALELGVLVLAGDSLPGQVARGLVLGLWLKPLLSWRMLRDEVQGVEQALQDSLDAGRARLGRLVSRDVRTLDAVAVRESAIESLAENLNDSVVAPLFWFVVGGLPLAAVYRFANTADAMWGYRGRYEWAGKWAARADDVLSWVPARLTALLLCLAARGWPGLARLRGEAALTPSPNGGWPMGAMACLLDVRLRKPGVYALHASGREAMGPDTVQALRWADAGVRWLAGAGWVLAGAEACAWLPLMWGAGA